MPVACPDLAGGNRGGPIGDAHADRLDDDRRKVGSQRPRQVRAVHDDQTRGAHRGGHQRPDVEQGAAVGRHEHVRQLGRRRRMREAELGTVLVKPAVIEQQSGPRLVELPVVQHDEAGIPDEERPHEVVARRVAHLVDDQIVGVPELAPDELVRGPDPDRVRAVRHDRRARRGHGALVDEDVDLGVVADQRQHLRRVVGDAGSHGRERGEPGQAPHRVHCSSPARRGRRPRTRRRHPGIRSATGPAAGPGASDWAVRRVDLPRSVRLAW